MSLLGRQAIIDALASGAIVCDPAPATVEGCHIDVTLGEWFWLPIAPDVVSVRESEPALCYRLRRADAWVMLPPRTHALCHTREAIGTTVADLQPFLQTRSTLARWGVPIHLSAGWGDPGFCSRWTLELYNPWPSTLVLPVGARVGCVGFMRVEGNDALYVGRYNAQEWKPEDMLPRRGNV